MSKKTNRLAPSFYEIIHNWIAAAAAAAAIAAAVAAAAAAAVVATSIVQISFFHLILTKSARVFSYGVSFFCRHCLTSGCKLSTSV